MEADTGCVAASMLLILLHKQKLRRKQRKQKTLGEAVDRQTQKFRGLPFISQRIGIGGCILLQKLLVPILIHLQFSVIEARVPLEIFN